MDQEVKFPYGDQFSPKQTPLPDLLLMAQKHAGSKKDFQVEIRDTYWMAAKNSRDTLAGNTISSLNAYGLIEVSGRFSYQLTDLGKRLISLIKSPQDFYETFAVHILTSLHGLTLLRVIESIKGRGEKSTVEVIGEELNEIGIAISVGSTYISSMRAWLEMAGVFKPAIYDINWDVVYSLLHLSDEIIDEMYDGLTPQQRFYLLALVRLGATQFTNSSSVRDYARSLFGVRFTSKNLVKEVLAPLEGLGLIETQKTTAGRGSKPHDVKLTALGANQLLDPLLEGLSKIAEMATADINRPFADVVTELADPDINVRGKALELFAIWLVRLLGLRFTKWRMRGAATGGGEVDVMAASDRIVYSRWQIQCKNLGNAPKIPGQPTPKKSVDLDTIAKEVGISFLTKADVIMVVTTGTFSSDAIQYSDMITDTSRYYVILIDKSNIDDIVATPAALIDVLNAKARRVFAKKEFNIDK